MATTTVVWQQGMHFCTRVESGELMCDESSEVGKAYPSAPELLMASLGSCIGSVLVYFAGRHDIALDWRLAERPHRIGEIDISVSLPRSVSDKERATLERVAHSCMIHNTLIHPPQIALELTAAP